MSPERPVLSPQESATGALSSPPVSGQAQPTLRHRPIARSATMGDIASRTMQDRRASVFSDLSETGKALRDSTDDIFRPRANHRRKVEKEEESSHWHSFPLGLALLPALAGIFIEGGGAVVTDLTLLSLAAVFLNWSVRIPWDWYQSARSTRRISSPRPSMFEGIPEELGEREDSDDPAVESSQELLNPPTSEPTSKPKTKSLSSAAKAAEKELQGHETLGLLSCFIGPVLGAWLLHAIRSQLSRPSEGLVSNYNLTVFLLAAEIRPLSHTIKLIQARTLYLQKVVYSDNASDDLKLRSTELLDLTGRIQELENHVADSAAKAEEQTTQESSGVQAVVELNSDVRKTIQSELDALNRAVRRYEKRTTVSTLQTDARISELEARLQDAIVLAAAAQRSVQTQPRNFLLILLNWVSAAVVLPAQIMWSVLNTPIKAATGLYSIAVRAGGASTAGKKDRFRDGRRLRSAGTGLKQREKTSRL